MKKNIIALSILLILPLMSATAFAMSSNAIVAFEEGVPEFGRPELDAGMKNMDIDFGTHSLPIGAQEYGAVDGDHTLRILDPRSDGSAGDWSVTVSLSNFASTSPANSFIGTIKLIAPTCTPGLTAEDPLMIISGDGATDVVAATAGLNKGSYDTTWAKEKISLLIGASAADSITEPADYSADLIWELQVA